MKKSLIILFVLLSYVCLTSSSLDKKPTSGNKLEKNFVTPPDEARIWVYWFWLNGNISRGGITADLEAMKRVGIGGVLIMEVDQGAPVGPVAFMSDEWRKLFKHMLSEAKRLGLEVNMNNDAGWNGSGGPWVPLDKAMQVVVSSEKQVAGGTKFEGVLPKPPVKDGFYRDISVLAYPTPKDPNNPSYRIKNLATKNMTWKGDGGIEAGPFMKVPSESVIARDRIIDLTSKMDVNGKLTWEAPLLEGSPSEEWTVIRFGHTFAGAVNAPAPLTGMGPECDKLSEEGIEANYNGMIGKLVKDLGPSDGKTFVSTHVDSWEIGAQNWTSKMREEFKRLRGYDMMPYMPVITGRIVDNPEISERFLRDLRQTVSDLVVENYIGHLRKLANKDGLKLSMESYSTPANDLDVANNIDEPICEFWWPNGGGYFWTPKSMASVAHVNGLPIVGAESFTAGDEERWLAHPASIKSLGDRAFCDGVNRYIVHRYAMQPWVEDRRPGMTMGPWGLHYERTQTWWEDSKAWHQYVARCQYMLRQGRFVADVLSLQSEEPMQRFQSLKLAGYDYDGIGPQSFLKNVTVKDGLLVLPSGMKYHLLVLPEVTEMTPQMLEKIKNLVEAGATVLGNPPVSSPGLSGYPESDKQVKTLVAQLWGLDNETDRKVGRGRVFKAKSPAEVLTALGVQPDFRANKTIRYIHRTMDDKEIFFVANSDWKSVNTVCKFRVTGMKPEAWNPETGRMVPISVFEESDGCTLIPLELEPSGSTFIVFKKGKVKASEQIVSIKHDGKELVNMNMKVADAAVKNSDVTNTFTMVAWIRPNTEIALPKETDNGISGMNNEGNNVVYPAPGHEVWTDKDAGAGFGAGRNGICVYEHSDSYYPAILVHSAPIIGWTHVAVVYQDGTPSLWLNGKFARKGLKSMKIVHGSIGVDHARALKQFIGQVTGLRQFPKALSTSEIVKLAQSKPDTIIRLQDQEFDFVGREISQKGTYTFLMADGKSHQITASDLPDSKEIKGPWELRFTPGWGAPEKVVLNNLISWSDHNDQGVKFFSGQATYRKEFDFSPVKITDSRLIPTIYLDLGQVAVMADVKLNGKDLGILWKSPYKIDITDYVKAGKNVLEISVVNLMINRMIGDELLPEDSERNGNGTLKKWPQWLQDGKPSPTGRFTFTSWRLWKKDSPLQESGLLGPVVIRTNVRIDFK